MTLMDIVALAKQGFTPADVKELIAMGNSSPDQKSDQGSVDDSEQKTDTKGDQNDSESTEDPADAIDYKSKYEELNSELDKLKADLQKAQSNNVRTDMSDHEEDSYEDRIKDLARSFM